MPNQDYSYDVALSFAGEDRKYAQELAQVLKARYIKVFYDEYEEDNLWGKNLYTHLSEVYQKQARFCVMFLSQHYAQKLWTNHERSAAQARAFLQENKEYILPIRLDHTDIAGIIPTIGYLKWYNADSIANAIVKKLEQETPSQCQSDSVNRIADYELAKSSGFDQIVKEQKSLSGEQRKKLSDALIDAFPNKSSLEQMLSFKLNKNLNAIAGEGSLQEIVFNLIRTAESQEWLLDLVRAARKSNPGNSSLQAIAQELFSPPEQSTQQQKILLLAANPKGKSQLRLDEELREEECFVQPVELEQPEGQVSLDSSFYIERPPIESDCYAAIVKPGALIRVKAARQMGKTSLMTRILDYGKHKGYRTVPVYFQEADGAVFTALDQLLQWFCTTIAEELKLPTGRIFELWQRETLGNKRKCTNYFQQNLLSEPSSSLVLGLDDVDLVFQHLQIAQDFFALLRTWHERGKNELIWQKLRLVIVHSREVYIPFKMHQSPFNVGVPIELPELTQSLVQDLAQRHGLNWQVDQTKQFMEMVGGHPYLVRVALYEIARERMTLANFLQVAPTEEGIFSDHLRRHLENLKGNRDLSDAMKQVIAANAPVQIDSSLSFQLRSMGLVKLKGNTIVTLCNLYRHYFHNRL